VKPVAGAGGKKAPTAAVGSAQRTIAVVLKGYPRLSETFIAQELHGLEGRGFRLRLVSLRHPTDKTVHPVHEEIAAPVGYLPEYLGDEPLRVLRGIGRCVGRPGFWRAFVRWVGDLARDRSASRLRRFGQACVMAAELPDDVAHLYAHFIHTPAAVTGYASTISGLPWSCSAHAKDIWTSPDWELRQNLARTSWVATCTEVGWQHLRSLSSSPATVHLIYHGLDLTRFPPRPVPQNDAGDTSRRDGSSPQTAVRFLSVGRAVEKKGFDVLLTALSHLPADLYWSWMHIGGGDLLEVLKGQAAVLGLAERIEWRGAVAQKDVLAAYAQSDLFVLPCRIASDGDRDGLPNVLVEAQSQRLACVSTPISGIPELIVDGETGRLVAPGDPMALAAALHSLARSPVERSRLALAGERRVRTAFDMHRGLGQLAQLFPEELVCQSGPSSASSVAGGLEADKMATEASP